MTVLSHMNRVFAEAEKESNGMTAEKLQIKARADLQAHAKRLDIVKRIAEEMYGKDKVEIMHHDVLVANGIHETEFEPKTEYKFDPFECNEDNTKVLTYFRKNYNMHLEPTPRGWIFRSSKVGFMMDDCQMNYAVIYGAIAILEKKND